jgi:hypothetical protein
MKDHACGESRPRREIFPTIQAAEARKTLEIPNKSAVSVRGISVAQGHLE